MDDHGTDWDRVFREKDPRLTEVHRGMRIWPRADVHAHVSDQSVPAGERAHALLGHIGDLMRRGHHGIGMSWTDSPSTARQAAGEGGWSAHGLTGRPDPEDADYDDRPSSMPVVLNAAWPEREHIETRGPVLERHGVAGYYSDLSQGEVPIRHGAPVSVTGISWKGNDREGAPWEHHEFDPPVHYDGSGFGHGHTAARGAELLGHFEAANSEGGEMPDLSARFPQTKLPWHAHPSSPRHGDPGHQFLNELLDTPGAPSARAEGRDMPKGQPGYTADTTSLTGPPPGGSKEGDSPFIPAGSKKDPAGRLKSLWDHAHYPNSGYSEEQKTSLRAQVRSAWSKADGIADCRHSECPPWQCRNKREAAVHEAAASEPIDLYHHTTPENAAEIAHSRSMHDLHHQQGDVFFSTVKNGFYGGDYGPAAVHVRVPSELAALNDSFRNGEKFYTVRASDIRPEHFVEPEIRAEAAGYSMQHTAPNPAAGHLPLHHYEGGDPDDHVRVYRAAPAGTESINPGDWVSLSDQYAHQHARQDSDPSHDWPVYTASVPQRHVHWDENDSNEHGYNGPAVYHPDVHDGETGEHHGWDDWHEENPHGLEAWAGASAHLGPEDHDLVHDEFESEDDRANALLNAARAQGSLRTARWRDDNFPARDDAEAHAAVHHAEAPEGHRTTAFTVHRDDEGKVADLDVHHYEPSGDPHVHRRYQGIDDLPAWHYDHSEVGKVGTARTAADDATYRGVHVAPGGPEDDPAWAAPMHDVRNAMPIAYEHPEYYPGGDAESVRQLRRAKGKPDHPVTIYRALPSDRRTFNTGDWVSTSAAYARQHGESNLARHTGWSVIKATVPARHLHNEGYMTEWGYQGPDVQGEHHAGPYPRHEVVAHFEELPAGPLFHGTDRELAPGSLVEPGHVQNWADSTHDEHREHVYATPDSSLAHAFGTTAGTEDIGGYSQQVREPRVYRVEPTGPMEPDPEDSHGGRMLRSRHPMRVAEDVTIPATRKLWGVASPEDKAALGIHKTAVVAHFEAQAEAESGVLVSHDQRPSGGATYPHYHTLTATHPDGTTAELRYMMSKRGTKGVVDHSYLPKDHAEDLGRPLVQEARRLHPGAFIKGLPGIDEDWGQHLPSVTSVHRNLTMKLSPEDHALVHDESVPRAQRARHLMGLMEQGGASMHWASQRGRAAAEQSFGDHEFRSPEHTQVSVNAAPPSPGHVETDPERISRHGGYAYQAPDWEVPLKEGAPVTVSSVRWRTGGTGWTHHQFRGGHQFTAGHQLPHQAAVVAHFEVTAAEFGLKPEWQRGPEGASDEEQSAHFDRQNTIRKDWEARVTRGISTGELHPGRARELGHYFDGHQTDRHGDPTWQPMPEHLYHVTTDLPGVRQHGLKTRSELAQARGGHGLGGGPDNMISVTDDHEVAKNILRAVHEFHGVVNGRYTPAQMWEDAKAGKGAPRPFHESLANYHQSGWKDGDPLPRSLHEAIHGVKRDYTGGSTQEAVDKARGPGWRPAADDEGWMSGHNPPQRVHAYWERDENPDERRQSAASFYKTFAAYRDYAGGHEDPLFFSTDAKAFAAKDPHHFGIVHARPRPGALGHPANSLGEWRTGTGDALEVTGDEQGEHHQKEGSVSLAARYAPGLPNPRTGGDEWFHGTQSQPGDFVHGFSHNEAPSHDEEELSGHLSHWNTLLGSHFAADHGVAEHFARQGASTHDSDEEDWGGDDPDRSRYQTGEPQSVIHARLHLRNPKVYDSEFDMDHEAYEHEHGERKNYIANHFRDGYEDEDHTHPDYDPDTPGGGEEWPLAARYRHDDKESIPREQMQRRTMFSNPDMPEMPERTRWLNSHPDKGGIARRFKERLRAQGHDGILYGNEFEGSHATGAGGHYNLSAIAFHPHQAEITQHHQVDAPCLARDEAEHQRARMPMPGQGELPGVEEHADDFPNGFRKGSALLAHFGEPRTAAGPFMQQKLFHMQPDPDRNSPGPGGRHNPADPEAHLHWRKEHDEDYRPDECPQCGGDRNFREQHADDHEAWLHEQDWHTDWEAEAPDKGEPIHRGMAAMLPQALHDRVHDASVPVEQRARELAHHITHGGGLGNFWSSDPDVSKNYAESTQHHLRYRYPKPNGEAHVQTPVMVHAKFPGMEHVETDPEQLEHWGVHSYHKADNREIPIKREAPLHVTGISWGDPGHGGKRSYDGPEHPAESERLAEDPHWTHHDFGEGGIQANATLAVVAHFEEGSLPEYHGEPLYHGTRARFRPGQVLNPNQGGKPRNFAESDEHSLFASTRPELARHFGEIASEPQARWRAQAENDDHGDYRPKVYHVEPTGPVEGDDDWAGEEGSYKTRHPLCVVREVHPLHCDYPEEHASGRAEEHWPDHPHYKSLEEWAREQDEEDADDEAEHYDRDSDTWHYGSSPQSPAIVVAHFEDDDERAGFGGSLDEFRSQPVQPYVAPPEDYAQGREHLTAHHGYTPEMHLPRNLPGLQGVHRGLHLPGPAGPASHQHDHPDGRHDPVFGSAQGRELVARFDDDDFDDEDSYDPDDTREDETPEPEEHEPEEEPVAHRNYSLPYMRHPPEGELIDHLHHHHGLDAQTSDLYMNAKDRERWHVSEHRYKTNSTHQHDHPQGTPGEEHWPDVFELSEHTDFTGGTRRDWSRVPGHTAPFKPLRTSESVSLPEVTAVHPDDDLVDHLREHHHIPPARYSDPYERHQADHRKYIFSHEHGADGEVLDAPAGVDAVSYSPHDGPIDPVFGSRESVSLPEVTAAVVAHFGEPYVAPPQSGDETWSHLQEAHGARPSAGSDKAPGADFTSALHRRLHNGKKAFPGSVPHHHGAPGEDRGTGQPARDPISRMFTPIPAGELEAQRQAREPKPERLDDREYSLRDVSRHYDWEGFGSYEIEHLVHHPERATFTKEDVPVKSLRHTDEHGGLVPPPSYRDIASQGEDERERLRELERGYDQGEPVPPIVTVRDGEHHIIADGSHRAAIHAERGNTHIPAFVTQRTIYPGEQAHEAVLHVPGRGLVEIEPVHDVVLAPAGVLGPVIQAAALLGSWEPQTAAEALSVPGDLTGVLAALRDGILRLSRVLEELPIDAGVPEAVYDMARCLTAAISDMPPPEAPWQEPGSPNR